MWNGQISHVAIGIRNLKDDQIAFQFFVGEAIGGVGFGFSDCNGSMGLSFGAVVVNHHVCGGQIFRHVFRYNNLGFVGSKSGIATTQKQTHRKNAEKQKAMHVW